MAATLIGNRNTVSIELVAIETVLRLLEFQVLVLGPYLPP
jgi:hypothetical protein